MDGIDGIDGVKGNNAAGDDGDEDTAPVASVEDTTVARSRDISRDDLAVEVERESTALEIKTMDEDGSRSVETVESQREVEEDMLDGTVMSNMVTRYIDSQETLPDSVVCRVLDSEDGDSNKVWTINWNKLS